jgi:two-component system sensor histidine kinase BarA
MLIKSLPTDIKNIKELYVTKKYPELLKQVHKLHGALCYCGLPRLKRLIACLETDLKNNIMINLSSLFDQLDIEISLLLREHAHKAPFNSQHA